MVFVCARVAVFVDLHACRVSLPQSQLSLLTAHARHAHCSFACDVVVCVCGVVVCVLSVLAWIVAACAIGRPGARLCCALLWCSVRCAAFVHAE